MTVSITWAEASARRFERQFLANPVSGGTPTAAADVVAGLVAWGVGLCGGVAMIVAGCCQCPLLIFAA